MGDLTVGSGPHSRAPLLLGGHLSGVKASGLGTSPGGPRPEHPSSWMTPRWGQGLTPLLGPSSVLHALLSLPRLSERTPYSPLVLPGQVAQPTARVKCNDSFTCQPCLRLYSNLQAAWLGFAARRPRTAPPSPRRRLRGTTDCDARPRGEQEASTGQGGGPER